MTAALRSPPGPTAELLRRAAASVDSWSWPRMADERWRATSLRALRDGVALPPTAPLPTAPWAAPLTEAVGVRLIGAAWELPAPTPEGVLAEPLTSWLARGARALDLFGSLANVEAESDAVIARNTRDFLAASGDRGLHLRVARGSQVPQPLVWEVAGGAAAPRAWIEVETGAHLELIEWQRGGGAVVCPVAEIRLHAGATLDHVIIGDTANDCHHLQTVVVDVGDGARYRQWTVLRGGAVSRVDTRVTLRGDHATCALHGVWAATGRQLHDCHTEVDHIGQHGTSRQLYKGLANDSAASVFRGVVRVAQQARFADAAQLNRNLLLSPSARAFGKPQLEIDNEDVRASHGSTTGTLDRGQLFYLRSRGLPEAEARRLLVEAFLAEAVAEVPMQLGDQPLASLLRAGLAAQLAGGSSEAA